MSNYKIAPSLLSADFARLGEEAQAVVQAGADLLHLDAMDNHFVPNLTVGPVVCQALRRYGITIPISVHLMAAPINRLLVEFARAGASALIFHPEATTDLLQSIYLVKSNNCKIGIALKPETPITCLTPILDKIDFILVMAVEPGFGGQPFLPESIDKISAVRAVIEASGFKISLGVDGGIKIDNIADVARAGADLFVAGTAIFESTNYAETIKKMREQLKQ